ncbi:MAG: two-component regulator propeller domain-containing protein [Bacteroidales bacterium]
MFTAVMVKNRIKLVFVGFSVWLLWTLLPAEVIGQNYELRINKIKDERGEDPGACFAIAEDAHGFLWFGTVDGLYRYDGFNYKIYRNEKGNANSLGWNTIRALKVDKKNRLWIGTQGAGLDCFDLNTEKFSHYLPVKGDTNSIAGTDIWALIIDRKGNIWCGVVSGGIDCYNPETGSFKHYRVLPASMGKIENITTRALLEDRKGNIWVGMAQYGLSVINPSGGSIRYYPHNPSVPGSLTSTEAYDLLEDSTGNIWVCTYGGGLNLFDEKNDKFIIYTAPVDRSSGLVSNLTRAIQEKRKGELWIGTEYGLTIWNKNRNTFSNHQHEMVIENTLSDNRLRSIFTDHKGIVWIASESGVDKVIEQHNFKIYKHRINDPSSFPEGIVRTILEDREGMLWIGLIDQGLVKYNPKTGKYIRYLHEKSNSGTISGIHVTSSFQDSQGTLWFGEWDTGLNRYDAKTGKFTLVASGYGPGQILTDNRIQCIREARPGILWIASENGVTRLDTRNMKTSYLLHDPANPNSLSGNSIQSNAFLQDKEGNLWIGTWSEGLNYVHFTDENQESARVIRWKHNPDSAEGLNNSNVISLHRDKQGILWIGTFGGGLNRFDPVTGKFRHFTTENGLPNNVIFGILEDNQGNLWLSTDRGLSKFDKTTESFQNFDRSDGLQDDHFFWGSMYKGSSGELFFGGIGGFNSFIPEKIVRNTTPPKAALTDLKVFDNSIVLDEPLAELKVLELPYDKNHITFEFAALDFTEPERNKYMVKMDGLNDEWQQTSNRRFVSYINLSPGKYTFRLRVSNDDGVWSTEDISIKVIIQPPWWKTWPARIIFILVIAGIGIGYNLFRVKLLTRQKNWLEKQVSLRVHEINQQKEELQLKQDELNVRNTELSRTLETLTQTQNQLVQSEKMASLGTLVAGIAHEINNPVNFISSGWQFLNEMFVQVVLILQDAMKSENRQNDLVLTRLSQHENWKEFLYLLDNYKTISENISTGIERTTEIIRSLNTYSRSGQEERRMYSLHKAIGSSLVILENRFKNRIQIKFSVPEELEVECNPGKINQLFMNILSNAIDSIDGEGQIEISSFLRQENMEVVIRDNGHGIPADTLSHVFDPFFTTKEVGKGTGLGLYISYLIVEQHRGKISINSTPGQGTEVRILLPVKAQ